MLGTPLATLAESFIHSSVQEAQVDQRTGQVEQSLEQVRPPLAADAKAAAEEAGERALDHPPVPPQPLAQVDAPPGKPWGDTPGATSAPKGCDIVGLVGVQLGRALTGSAAADGAKTRCSWVCKHVLLA